MTGADPRGDTVTGAEPRPRLRDVAPYTSPQLDVAARLNTNECPHPLPETFFEQLAEAVRTLPLHRYPDSQMRRLREDLADTVGHSFEGTWTANGSNEILVELLHAYGGPGRRALTFEPTYLLHSRLCWLTHTDVERRSLPSDFVMTDRQVDEAVHASPDVVFVCSPNNPTGNVQPSPIVGSLAERLPSALIVVDEAYVEFGGETALPLVAEHPNVAVVRTFSKAFALAGARIGYVLTSPAIVGDLERVRLPYHASSLTQAAGIIALRHRPEALAILDSIRVQRDRILDALRAIDGVTVFPSDANFVLFVPSDDAKALWQRLLDHGVLVRDMTSVVPNALRVTAGTEHEVDLFLKAIDEELRR
ncbi:MAG TPA: histidinol-phosphate transaminase [Actinomycetota bacterium]|nr:histidinol-phosphate transaminase [Actinomycetota bacterium]